MLIVNNLQVRFGAFTAVDNVSLSVAQGELLGLAGTNGAGKSTLFAAVAGQTPIASGSVEFCGTVLTHQPAHRRAASGLARTFQVPREFGALTVLENLLAAAPNEANETLSAAWLFRGRAARRDAYWTQQAEAVLRQLKLAHVRDLPAAGLSGGQKKLLELARILIRKPKMILLDEPFAGVNPVLIGALMQVLRQLHEDGITLVVVEHHLQALKALCSRMVVMDQGRILADGTPDAVLDSPAVQAAYMGGAE